MKTLISKCSNWVSWIKESSPINTAKQECFNFPTWNSLKEHTHNKIPAIIVWKVIYRAKKCLVYFSLFLWASSLLRSCGRSRVRFISSTSGRYTSHSIYRKLACNLKKKVKKLYLYTFSILSCRLVGPWGLKSKNNSVQGGEVLLLDYLGCCNCDLQAESVTVICLQHLVWETKPSYCIAKTPISGQSCPLTLGVHF